MTKDRHDLLVKREHGRNPDLWFCSARDEHGMPRVFGRGDTEAEALANARTAAADYRAEKVEHRVMAPLAEWTFTVHAPIRRARP